MSVTNLEGEGDKCPARLSHMDKLCQGHWDKDFYPLLSSSISPMLNYVSFPPSQVSIPSTQISSPESMPRQSHVCQALGLGRGLQKKASQEETNRTHKAPYRKAKCRSSVKGVHSLPQPLWKLGEDLNNLYGLPTP